MFFAANIYTPPTKSTKNKVGFYLSIYGNRAFSEIDSLNNFKISNKIEIQSDTTFNYLTFKNVLKAKRTVDNFGILISPLINIPDFISTKDPESDLNLYYSPSLELIYRRTRITTEKLKNQSIDTLKGLNLSEINKLSNNSNSSSNFNSLQQFHEYFLNIVPLGMFMSLENKKISVRVQANVGFAFSYEKSGISILNNSSITMYDWNLMFAGRSWITEPKTGLTLQAEVTNTFKNSKPFFAVTLSKAFSFEKLASIFQPITIR